MALSNWDTLAFDENAKPTNGVIEGFVEGTGCEIYKNWLYVRDEGSWTEGRSYMCPTIAEIRSGDLCLAGFDIEAVRGPQEAIFAKVTATRYKEQEKDKPYQRPDVRLLAGIGCSGYQTPFEIIMEEEGLDPKEWEPLTSGSSGDGKGPRKLIFTFQKIGETEFREFERDQYPTYETRWVGVLPSTLAEFIKWLKSNGSYGSEYDKDYTNWVDKIEKAEALRVNQGDMYFAKNAGIELSVTPVGQQKKPIMEHLCEAMAKENEEKKP